MTTRALTRIGNLDADAAALELLSIERQGLHETFTVTELGIGKALGSLLFAILDDSDADDVAALEELGDGLLGGVVRQVTEVESVRGLVGNLLGEVLPDAGIASIIATTVA
jgi:hypothetical protein